ncbi:hypothetical protein BABA_01270 [Neobacillus bataviensis LMG 21833]|uniref:Uncharacterized protein n=1 Tax=Neobacillus bataviensis LMG 21833 TaxID=1117379 RepID=K6DT34_9BACI|nr:hypothetical protein [Neobacillus bataviensis]EKN71489.1 hypothetical protein BABA_01270 [Neobacillus bataviensis LMG 21833]
MNFQIMFYGGIAGAILSLILSIIVFIKFNISEAFEDLTGFSIHKWVKKLQQRRRSRQEQFNKPITREIQPRRDVELEAVVTGGADATELLAEAAAVETSDAASTELLTEAAASTELLAEAAIDETELLASDAAATELLSVESDETELLNEEAEETTILSEPVLTSYFIKERDVVIVHTDATI